MVEIIERWNPNDPLAQHWYSPHPNKDQKLYAISNGVGVYSKSKDEFIYEPSPSNRTDEFIIDTRFTLEEANSIIRERGWE